MLKQTTLIVVALFCVVTSCSKFETLNEPEFLLQQNKITADEITETTFEGTFQHGDPIPGQYIVVFKDDAFSQTEMDLNKSFNSRANIVLKKAEKLIAQRQLAKESIYQSYGHALKGFAVKMNETQALEIAKNPLVEYVEQDRFVILGPGNGKGNGGNNGGTPPPQSTPWGITRVGGHADGTGTTAWVIDSGIDLDHPDLNVNTGLSQSFLSGGGPNQSADDQHGHGTHVAGTIGAIDNSEGVVGVAANATVISVRVLDRKGSGSTSGVIAGVNYVAANAGSNDVANMSLGGGISTTLDNAVIAASNTCRFVLAAGNESDDANNHSPARANGPNVYTISAMDINDNFASFSNFGSAVDYCAPGVSISSTWKDGGYNTISGTSMAAPHAAGVLLLTSGTPNTGGTVNNDPDGNPDLIIVR